jgi:hypothetical protein
LRHLYGAIGIGISEGHIIHAAHAVWGGLPLASSGVGWDFTSLELTEIWIKVTVANKDQDYGNTTLWKVLFALGAEV